MTAFFAYLILKLLETVHTKRHWIFKKKLPSNTQLKEPTNILPVGQHSPYHIQCHLYYANFCFKKSAKILERNIHPKVMIRGMVSSIKNNCATIQ